MSKILNFPSKDLRLTKIIEETIQKAVPDNPQLAKCFEDVANEIRSIIRKIDSNIPKFQLKATNDSIQENIQGIETSVKKMSGEYTKIIYSLLSTIADEKISVCKLRYE